MLTIAERFRARSRHGRVPLRSHHGVSGGLICLTLRARAFGPFSVQWDGLPVASLVIFAVGGLMYLAMSAATRSTMSTRAIAVRRPGWIARRRARGGIAHRRGHVGCRLSSADRPGPSDRKKRVKWVLDADLRDFFGSLEHSQLIRFVEHRIGDKRVVRLIRRWFAAGVLEDGAWTQSEAGTPQGGSISPLAANLYMHYVFDLWVQRWRRTTARGDVVIVRYLDDFIVGFQYREDAEQFLSALRERLGQFGLTLHPDKTRLLEFGRFAAENRQARGQGKPETFQFLGFVHACGQTRTGWFIVHRHTAAERVRAKLKEVKAELRQRMHAPVPEVGNWLAVVV